MTYGERWKNMLSYATTTLGYELLGSRYTNYEGAAPGFSIEVKDSDEISNRLQLITSVVPIMLNIACTYWKNVKPFVMLDSGNDVMIFQSVLPKSVFAFVNSEEFFEYPRPISHKTIFIGGIGVKKAKPLNEEYKEIMNNANGPVVLVSFGSVAKSAEMPLHIRNVFIETFTRLPEVTFIWKYETSVADDIVANLTNVITKKWVPQTDLLAHPKLRAFLTHAGQNSVTESIHAGVPMVCIPLYGDQQRNGKIAEKKNVAVVLDKRALHADLLTEAIRNVLYNGTRELSEEKLH
ncbi:unnamed protein product [Anisakis simplex]|uniref:UDP-glucuronosyltransferase n=1 Tax=Anisakis simplex TaxID=6269 RepID=A0A0M3J4X9_ANISI|nr:unnamed protein product [Anisakis simplex]